MLRALIACVALAAPAAAWAQVDEDVPADCTRMVDAIGAPELKSEDDDVSLLCRKGYVLAHDNQRKTPIWVVERLKPDRFKGDARRKGVDFKADKELPEGSSATKADYSATGTRSGRSFDRGHMAPAGDMKFSQEAMVESFLMSNMAPQQGQSLNRHIWADLEKMARDWACDRLDVYVITGPIYDHKRPETVGEKVAVPDAFYKIVYEPRQRRAISFILPNEPVAKEGRKAQEVLADFIEPLKAVEARTGVRFLTGIDAGQRRRLLPLKSVMWNVVKGCTKQASSG